MAKVFISYGSHDRRVADSLCSWLEGRGIPCWIAPRDISSGNYAGEITRALRSADIILVVCSKASCQSEHVKNEVTLAFNNAKQIIPYCLEENAFDDDLEYFLASKQRVSTSGDSNQDFALLEKMIREYRNETPSVAQSEPSRRSRKWIPITAGILVLLLAGIYFSLNRPVNDLPSTDLVTTDSLQAATDTLPAPELPAEKKASPVRKTDPEANTFTDKILNGYPDGFGTYTFRKPRRIDMHDPEGRTALAGDYIVGNWKDGHLNYGEWYDADGHLKAFIQLGDQPDTEPDHTLGTCRRP